MMKKIIPFLILITFLSLSSKDGFSQEAAQQTLRFVHDFNVIGIKSEKDAIWLDTVMKKVSDVIVCHTDYITGHTTATVNEAINSIIYIKRIAAAAGFEIDDKSFTSKYERNQ